MMGSISTQQETQHASQQPPKFGKGIRVGVIGAGLSGICAAAHLLREGADVTVFERSGVSSGLWYYDSRITNSPAYPSEKPSAGDYLPSNSYSTQPNPVASALKRGQHDRPLSRAERDALEIAFAPPGPCYAGLKTNIASAMMFTSLGAWPPGTETYIGHLDVQKYLRALSADFGVDDVTIFNTRVENARKSSEIGKWVLNTISLLPGNGLPQITERHWEFDALVVASGHYNLPRVPDIPGLAEWKERFGDRIIHTKEYRHAETYRDKRILIVGAGTSAMDVSREAEGLARGIIQSTRGGEFDLPKSFLPQSVEQVTIIEKFILDETDTTEHPDPLAAIPGRVILQDGQVLKDIDNVILATGYITSYPFLPQYHSDEKELHEADLETLVTSDGQMVHNLYKDIFYTEDPSLSFIGLPCFVSTFSLFDLQARAVARVLTGKSHIPSREALRQEYEKVKSAKGLGRKFHSLLAEGAELAYVHDLIHWVNSNTVDSDAKPIEGPTKEWLDANNELMERRAKFFKGQKDRAAVSKLISPLEKTQSPPS